MKKLSLFFWIMLATPAWSAQPDFFPLQVGNQWVLQSASPARAILNIEVLRSRTDPGGTYYLLAGYGLANQWVRQSADGTLYALDESSSKEVVLAQLSFSGTAYKSTLSGCEQTARALSTPVFYKGPNVEAERSLVVQYAPDGCRDIGFTQETYAPGIGPVHRALTTFAGEKAYHLIYARVNGVPVLAKSKEIVLAYDFDRGSNGWLPGFSDYSFRTSDLRMKAEVRPLPDEVSRVRSGFYLQSMNRSDDLFMFLKKELSTVDGLDPNQAYRIYFDIRFASNAASGCVGVGGSPGESVYLKAGATPNEPVALRGPNGDIRVSVDKGDQSVGGSEAGVFGDISNGTPCEGTSRYASVHRDYAHPSAARTDDRGALWLIIGTDSGYEGLTGLYIDSITVRINPWSEPAK